MSDPRVRRLQRWVIAISIVVVFLGILVPTAVIIFTNNSQQDTQLLISCTTAKSNIEQLHALKKIGRELGLPSQFHIPALPEECK